MYVTLTVDCCSSQAPSHILQIRPFFVEHVAFCYSYIWWGTASIIPQTEPWIDHYYLYVALHIQASYGLRRGAGHEHGWQAGYWHGRLWHWICAMAVVWVARNKSGGIRDVLTVSPVDKPRAEPHTSHQRYWNAGRWEAKNRELPPFALWRNPSPMTCSYIQNGCWGD